MYHHVPHRLGNDQHIDRRGAFERKHDVERLTIVSDLESADVVLLSRVQRSPVIGELYLVLGGQTKRLERLAAPPNQADAEVHVAFVVVANDRETSVQLRLDDLPADFVRIDSDETRSRLDQRVLDELCLERHRVEAQRSEVDVHRSVIRELKVGRIFDQTGGRETDAARDVGPDVSLA